MFICKLCDDNLGTTQSIVGTYCGHIFHRDCLMDKQHSILRSECPTCKESLLISKQNTQVYSCPQGLAIYPLRPERRPSGRSVVECRKELKHKFVQENIILRQQVVHLTQAVIILQKEKKDMQRLNTEVKKGQKNKQKIEMHQFRKNSFGTNGMVDWLFEDIGDNIRQVAQKQHTGTIDSGSILGTWEKAKDRDYVLRSKRREFLTWRNKAQSWLTKMEKASDKLLEKKEDFTHQEYLHQLILFYNKLLQQGQVIKTVKETGLIYLLIGDASRAEKEIILVKLQSLKSDYENVLTKILEGMDTLTAPQKLALLPNDHVMQNDDSHNDMKCINLRTLHVPPRPRSTTGNETVHLKSGNADYHTILSLANENDSSRTPIFV